MCKPVPSAKKCSKYIKISPTLLQWLLIHGRIYAALKNRDVSAITSISAYADASSGSGWATNAMRWATGEGLIQGSNNTLRPQSNATRAEVATILMRFCELLNK